MAIADWIREATQRRREKLRREGYLQGYAKGYADADAGKPPNPPSISDDKPQGMRDAESGKRS